MQFYKRMRLIIPISTVGIGLLASSIITTQHLLGRKELTWNTPYNQDYTTTKGSTKNPKEAPGEYSSFQSLNYDNWSQWIKATKDDKMHKIAKDAHIFVNIFSSGNYLSNYESMKYYPSLGFNDKVRRGHYWDCKKRTSTQAIDPKTGSVNTYKDANTVDVHYHKQSSFEGQDAYFKSTSEIASNHKIGGDVRTSLHTLIDKKYGNSSVNSIKGSRMGSYGIGVNPNAKTTRVVATKSIDSSIEPYTFGIAGRGYYPYALTGYDFATYNLSEFEDDEYMNEDGSNHLYMGKQGSDGYLSAINFHFVLPSIWCIHNIWHSTKNQYTPLNYRDWYGFSVGNETTSWNSWTTGAKKSSSIHEHSMPQRKMVAKEADNNAPFYSGGDGICRPIYWFSKAAREFTSFGGQFFLAYDGYHSSNIGLYTTKAKPDDNNRIEQTTSKIDSSDSRAKLYPSQILANPSVAKECFKLKYDLPSSYYLANVKARYNDDLGFIHFKVSYPSIKTYDDNLNSFKDYEYSVEKDFYVGGFKNNATNFTNTIIDIGADIGSKIVASSLISKEEIRDIIWKEIIKDHYLDGSGHYRDDKLTPDNIINNWDRIPGFNKNDLNILNVRYRIASGVISVSLRLKKWITEDGVIKSGDDGPPSTITITGYRTVTTKTDIKKRVLCLGEGQSISSISSMSKSEGMKHFERLLYNYQKVNAYTDKRLIDSIDDNLMKFKPLSVVDYVVHPTQGVVDLAVTLNKIYDPDSCPDSPIDIAKPMVRKIRITGYRGIESRFLETNTTTRVLANQVLIAQKPYQDPKALEPPGIKIKASHVGNTKFPWTYDVSYDGLGHNIQSLYYDQSLNQFVGLIWDDASGKMQFVSNDNPSDFHLANASSIKYITDNMEPTGQLKDPSLLSSLRMVPLNNPSGIVHSYLIFPTLGSGVFKDNDPVFIITFNNRNQAVINKLPYGSVTGIDKLNTPNSIIAMGGYDEGKQPDGQHHVHLNAVVAINKNEITYKHLDVSLPPREKLIATINKETSYKPKTIETNSFEKNMLEHDLSKGKYLYTLPTYKNRNYIDLYQVNLPTIKAHDGSYHSVWNRMIYTGSKGSEPSYESQRISFNKDKGSKPHNYKLNIKKFDIVNNHNKHGSLGDYSTLLKPNGIDNIYTSSDQSKIIYNTLGFKPSVIDRQPGTIDAVRRENNRKILEAFSNNAYAVIYDIASDQKQLIKIGDVKAIEGEPDKNTILIPDQASLNKNFVLTFNQLANRGLSRTKNLYPTTVNYSTLFGTKYEKLSYISKDNFYTEYENYLSNKNVFINQKIYPLLLKRLKHLGLSEILYSNECLKNISIGKLYWDFDKGELKVLVTLSKSISDKLNTSSQTNVFKIKYSQKKDVGSINAIDSKWRKISLADLTKTINDLNKKTKKYDDYFILKSSLHSSTLKVKPKIINITELSRDNLQQKATLAVTVDKGLKWINDELRIVKNIVHNITVNLKDSIKPLPNQIDISKNHVLSSYPPSELVAILNGNGTIKQRDEIIKQIKQSLLTEMKVDKTLKDKDITMKYQFSFNNSLGVVKLKVSIPKWIDKSSTTSQYFEHEIEYNGFLKYPPTSVAPVAMNIIKTKFPELASLTPSQIKDYINEKWYNIYKFITIQNPVGNKAPPWVPWVLDHDCRVTANPHYNLEAIKAYSKEQINELENNNTTVHGKAIKPVLDETGKLQVEMYIKNCFNADDNTQLEVDSTGKYKPHKYSTASQVIELEGFSVIKGQNKTRFPKSIELDRLKHNKLMESYPYQVNKDSKLLSLLTEAIKDSGIELASEAKINILRSYTNNRNGTMELEFVPSHINLASSGVVENINPVTKKPYAIYKTTVKGFSIVDTPTQIKAKDKLFVNCKIENLSEKLFDKEGKLNPITGKEYIEKLMSFRSISKPISELIYDGKVCSINVQDGTALVKFKLSDYVMSDKTYSHHIGVEIILRVASSIEGIHVLSATTRTSDSDGWRIISEEETKASQYFHDFLATKNEMNKHDAKNMIIAICSLGALWCLVLVLSIYYRKMKYFQRK